MTSFLNPRSLGFLLAALLAAVMLPLTVPAQTHDDAESTYPEFYVAIKGTGGGTASLIAEFEAFKEYDSAGNTVPYLESVTLTGSGTNWSTPVPLLIKKGMPLDVPGYLRLTNAANVAEYKVFINTPDPKYQPFASFREQQLATNPTNQAGLYAPVERRMLYWIKDATTYGYTNLTLPHIYTVCFKRAAEAGDVAGRASSAMPGWRNFKVALGTGRTGQSLGYLSLWKGIDPYWLDTTSELLTANYRVAASPSPIYHTQFYSPAHVIDMWHDPAETDTSFGSTGAFRISAYDRATQTGAPATDIDGKSYQSYAAHTPIWSYKLAFVFTPSPTEMKTKATRVAGGNSLESYAYQKYVVVQPDYIFFCPPPVCWGGICTYFSCFPGDCISFPCRRIVFAPGTADLASYSFDWADVGIPANSDRIARSVHLTTTVPLSIPTLSSLSTAVGLAKRDGSYSRSTIHSGRLEVSSMAQAVGNPAVGYFFTDRDLRNGVTLDTETSEFKGAAKYRFDTSPVTGGHLKLEWQRAPDGNWSYYEYNSDIDSRGTVSRITRPHAAMSSPPTTPAAALGLSLVTDFSYTNDWDFSKTLPLRVVTRQIDAGGTGANDRVVSWVEYDYSDSRFSGALSNLPTYQGLILHVSKKTERFGAGSGDALTTITKRFRVDTDRLFAGLPFLEERPDGTQTVWLHRAGQYDGVNRIFTVPSGFQGKVLGQILTNTADRAAAEFQAWKVSAFNPSVGGAVSGCVALGDSEALTNSYVVPLKSTAEVTTRDKHGRVRLVETLLFTGKTGTNYNWRLVNAEAHEYDAGGNLIVSYEYVKSGNNEDWWKSYEARYTTRLEDHLDYASISFDNAVGVRTERKQVERDRSGVIKRFYYDTYGRVERTVELQPPAVGSLHRPPPLQTVYTYDADNRVLTTSVGTHTGTSTPDSAALTSSREFNLAGLVTKETAVGGYVTTTDYANGGRTVTQTQKGTNNAPFSTVIRDSYVDGQPKSVNGTGSIPQFTEHAIESTGVTVTVGGVARKQGRFKRTESRGSASATTTRKVITEQDWLGRITRQTLANPAGVGDQVTTYTYYTTGSLAMTQVSGLAPVVFLYNPLGELTYSGVQLNGMPPPFLESLTDDGLSSDRINSQLTGFFIDADDIIWEYSDNLVWSDAKNATNRWLQTTWRKRTTEVYPGAVYHASLGSVGIDYRELEVVQTDTPNGTTYSRTYVGRNQALTLSEATSTAASSASFSVSLNGRPVYSSSAAGVVTEVNYDNYGRPWRTRSRTGDAETYFATSPDGHCTTLPQWQKSPDGIWVQTAYQPSGRVASTKQYTTKTGTQPSGGDAGITTYFSYNDRGQTLRVWGDTAYPTEYEYYESGTAELIGELKEQRTYNGGSGWTGSAWPDNSTDNPNRTKFAYYSENGLLKEKQCAEDAAGSTLRKIYYTYNVRRDLKTRVGNANNAATTTTYNYYEAPRENTGELMSVTYGDGTPTVSYKYNRTGTLIEVSDAAGTRQFTYRSADLQMDAEALPSGLYGSGLKMTRTYDGAGRLNGYWHGTSAAASGAWVTYGFDPGSGRLGTVATPVGEFNYGYLANSDLIAQVNVPVAGTQLFHDRQYAANANVLNSWRTGLGSSANSLAPLAAFAFQRDDRNRISKFGQTGRIYDPYGSGVSQALGYNDRNEVTGAASYLTGDPNQTATAIAVPRRNYVFNYDNAGNRTSTKVDADTTLTYTPNYLGQYAKRQRAHHVEVSGLAGKGSTVTATRSGTSFSVTTTTLTSPDYNFIHGLSTRAAGSPAAIEALAVTSTRTSPNANQTQTRNVLAPAIPASVQASETFAYDLDGNLTQDDFWDYRYDLENRIRQIETRSGLPGGIPKVRVSFVYDYLGRRVKKTVETWNGSAYVVNNTRAFAYDGWNLIAEYAVSGSTLTLDRTYHWGLDLSGSIHGAGGIGGLVGINLFGGTPQALLAVNDFNGNVVGLVDRLTGNLAAAYEYSPFGELLRASGPAAESNPLRFSSKYLDAETDLLNFGYRYYSPSLGRFVNRDPVNEAGRLQLGAPLMESSVAVWSYIGAQGGAPGKSPQLTPDTSVAKGSQPHSNDRSGGRRNSTLPGNVMANRKGNGGGNLPGLFIAYSAPPVYSAENPYLYVGNGPYAGVDPLGLSWLSSLGDWWSSSNVNPSNWSWGMSYSGETYSPRLPRPGEDMSDVRMEYAMSNQRADGMVFQSEYQEGKENMHETWKVVRDAAITEPLGLLGSSARIVGSESRFARTATSIERATESTQPGFFSRMWGKVTGLFSKADDVAEIKPLGACFVKGTEVAAENGPKPIEEIQTGDLVWAWDQTTGEVALKTVVNTFNHMDVELVAIQLGDVSIEATAEHPFWVDDVGWTGAAKLKVGDSVKALSGSQQVTDVRRHSTPAQVFNLEVAGFHTYFVSSAQVLVHNQGKSVVGNVSTASGMQPAQQLVDLTDFRSPHILNRHRAGAGISGKTEFPASWSDQQILHHVSDVATDPAAVTGMGKWNSPYAIGVRDGVEIRVDFYPTTHPTHAGKISTAYPINVAPNP